MLEDILELHKQGKLEEAESRYRELLTFNPDDPETLHLLGIVRRQRGDIIEAMRMVSRAIELAPDRANYYGSLAGMELHARLYDRAREHFEKAVELNPNFTSAYSALGQIAMIRGEQGRAEDHFKLALQATPDHPQVLTSYGNLLMGRGEVDQALKHFSRAAELNPTDVPTQGSLGRALLRKGHYAFAEQALNNALLNKPDYHPARFLLAEAHTLQGRYPEATQALLPLFEVRDQQPFAYAALGDIERAEGKYREAITHYRTALTLRREQPRVMHALAWCLARIQLRREAVAAYRDYLQHAPEDREARQALAGVLTELGWHDDAIATLREALALAPQDRTAQTALAALLEATGDLEGSETTAAAVAAVEPTPAVMLVLARAALRRGDIPAVAEALAKLDPAGLNAAQARLAAMVRGLAADSAGDTQAALEAWQQAHTAAPAGRKMPRTAAIPEGLREHIEAATAHSPGAPSRRPSALLLGAPGSGVERVAALLADCARVLLLSDRFSAEPRHDQITAPEYARYAGDMGDEDVRLFQRHYEKPLERLGVPEDRALVEWLPHFDARMLPVLHRAWGKVPLVVVRREPRDALLNWLAYGGPHGYRLQPLDAGAQWLAQAQAHLDFTQAHAQMPVLVLDAAEVERDPQGTVVRLADFLGLPAWQPTAATARAGSTLGGLPANLPQGRHETYANELDAAFGNLAS